MTKSFRQKKEDLEKLLDTLSDPQTDLDQAIKLYKKASTQAQLLFKHLENSSLELEKCTIHLDPKELPLDYDA